MHCKIWKVGFTLKDMHTDCVKIWLQPSRSEARVSYSWSKTPLNFVYALQCNLHVMQASSLCRLAIHEDSKAPEFVNLSENLRESVRKGRVCGLMGPLLLLSHLLFLCLCPPFICSSPPITESKYVRPPLRFSRHCLIRSCLSAAASFV